MRHLLDTNTWSYLQEGHPVVLGRLQRLPASARLFLSVVSQAELLGGVYLVEGDRRRTELARVYQEVIAMAAEILPATPAVAEEFAKAYAALRRKGRPIGTNDMWIAAIARANGLVLVSSDAHLHHVDGLTVEDWTTPPDPPTP